MEWKHINGWELIRDIAEGKIKSGTQIKVHSPNYDTNYWFWGNWFGEKDGYSNKPDNIELYLCQPHCTFELIKEQQDIDGEELIKRIENLKERIEKLEKNIDRFKYFAKRVEEIDSSKGIFRYC